MSGGVEDTCPLCHPEQAKARRKRQAKRYKQIRAQFLANQMRLCNEKGLPYLMPSNGVCWNCAQDIIDRLIQRGNDGTTLVTGCPLCSRSYCD